ncbi:MAG: hypothetical protein NVS2B14_09050 [Chamaesiphon sp.]
MSSLSFVQTSSNILRQPSALAALASVGIHGLFALSLPILSHSSKPEEDQNMRGTVKVVELAPAQLSRLPQPSQLPPLAYQSQPLSSSPPLPYVAQPLPPLNSYPDIRSIPLPPLSRSELPEQTLRNEDSLPMTVPEIPRLSIRRQTSPKFRIFDKPAFAGRRFSIAQSETSNHRQFPVESSHIRKSELSTNRPVLIPHTFPPSSVGNLHPQPQTTENSQQPTTDKPDFPLGSAASLKPQPQTAENPNPQSSPDTAANESELQRQHDLTRDNSSTSNEDAQRNYIDWSVKRGMVEKPEQISIIGSYPQEACIKKLEGTAVIGVSIDPNNNISEPKLMKSSGYPIFNQKALEDVTTPGKLDNKTGQPKTYLVSVKYEYNSKFCLDLKVPKP